MTGRPRLVVTGSSGRIGRAIVLTAADRYEVTGIDIAPAPTTALTLDINDYDALARAAQGAKAIVHAAALHAPHVGAMSDATFRRVNIEGTATVARAAVAAGVSRLVFTSSTAVYGAGATASEAAQWIDAQTLPNPRTIYHTTKLAAETRLFDLAGHGLQVAVLRMGRCFAEPANVMAVYRLHRGIDVRDVANAHLRAVAAPSADFAIHVIAATTPFRREDVERLAKDAPGIIEERCPGLFRAFAKRGWPLPQTIDRVYDNSAARLALDWDPVHGYEAVLAAADAGSEDVLAPTF